MAVSEVADARFTRLWRAFRIAGQWQRQPPCAEGTYPVANRDGGFRGYVQVWRDATGLLIYQFRGHTAFEGDRLHRGWWWSLPVPPLPAAQVWRD